MSISTRNPVLVLVFDLLCSNTNLNFPGRRKMLGGLRLLCWFLMFEIFLFLLLSRVFCRSCASWLPPGRHSRVGRFQILCPVVGRSVGACLLEVSAQNRQVVSLLSAKGCLPRWRLQSSVFPCQAEISLLLWEAIQTF